MTPALTVRKRLFNHCLVFCLLPLVFLTASCVGWLWVPFDLKAENSDLAVFVGAEDDASCVSRVISSQMNRMFCVYICLNVFESESCRLIKWKNVNLSKPNFV